MFPGYKLTRLAGELQSVDGYMNIALEKCEEYVNGKLRRSYGDAFVRGNNGKGPFKHIGEKMLTLDLLKSAIHLFHMINENKRGMWPGKHVQCQGIGPVQRIETPV